MVCREVSAVCAKSYMMYINAVRACVFVCGKNETFLDVTFVGTCNVILTVNVRCSSILICKKEC